MRKYNVFLTKKGTEEKRDKFLQERALVIVPAIPQNNTKTTETWNVLKEYMYQPLRLYMTETARGTQSPGSSTYHNTW
jgi:hypothetical protein